MALSEQAAVPAPGQPTRQGEQPAEQEKWYVMRDLKRHNAKSPAYKVLPELGFTIFTPMHWVLRTDRRGGKRREMTPYIPSLLIVRARREDLDPVVSRIDTLQYQYARGGARNTPMTVPAAEMAIFMRAVSQSPDCTYYSPDELTADMIGRRVAICGGMLEGLTGRLLKLRGTRKRRLIVELTGIITAAVEVSPEYIRLLD